MAGIYIHIPFCRQACHYCDFHFSTSLSKKQPFITALLKELELRSKDWRTEKVETIYFGGGTPSILDTGELNQILEQVHSFYHVSKEPEITLEANPDDLKTEQKYLDLKNAGVNRLSMGIQSFFDRDLKLMNRSHDAGEAQYAIELATKHFENVTIDLIYGTPGLSDLDWIRNIELALGYGVPHISSYALTVEPKTALEKFIERGAVSPVDEEQAERQFRILTDKLNTAGYIHYELSNFGKPGFFSKANTGYWLGKKYGGFGPSAHSYDGTRRSWNIASNPVYIKKLLNDELPSESEVLTVIDRYNEYIMTGLRTIWGVDLERIKKDYGVEYLEYLKKESSSQLENGLLELQEIEGRSVLRTTSKGRFLADGIASSLFFIN
ncbi:radical SAM family heme chaperone HemW [Robertkochia solimangrovi]|uniref:radical SAM family heme chaperone HemW n=1 Tax=Robertkochia solimangrovi TaxID=2213046 RepID=UPI001180F22D|nr:radical SAM family heme chaperone HemW [Robertkochia solimangrovi]TRZ46309.1 coproporphyrinogen III oxidase [Robertkochia solimangrovi]